jgi:uncharacterized protein
MRSATLDEKHQHLKRILRETGRALVAFSGGVDSALLLKVAVDALGDRALAVTAVSPSLPAAERALAVELAQEIGARHLLVETGEMANPDFLNNDARRCYHCKRERFGALNAYARQHGYAAVLDGSNRDDGRDYRPGQQAAEELGIRQPLIEAGFAKADVRALARQLNLRVWDKPSAACLVSRIPYGAPLTPAVLAQVERAEGALHALGYRAVRVRHHGEVARIEVPPARLGDALAAREAIARAVKEAGYTYVSLDLEGYRLGSLNKVLDIDG